MHIGLAALYIRKYVDKETKKNVEEMVFNIKNQLKNTIEKVCFVILIIYKVGDKINRFFKITFCLL